MTCLNEPYTLYQVAQKQDETHDSYLARHDAAFEDLLGRKVTLEEVRAYVLMRQSLGTQASDHG